MPRHIRKIMTTTPLLAILVVLALGGCTTAQVATTALPSAVSSLATTGAVTPPATGGGASAPGQSVAAAGDLATAHYTAALEDGTIFSTTRKEVADDPAIKKVSWYTAPPVYKAETVVVGKPSPLVGIEEALAGMSVGEHKRLTLPADKAFGPSDPAKLLKFPVSRTFPTTVVLSAEEYVKRLKSFPSIGQDVPLTPYFPARVTALRDKEVELKFQVADGASFNDDFGTTTVSVANETITTSLRPIIGAPFPLQEGFGMIAATDGTTFTVDTNHPLAGKSIVIDLDLVSLTKAADLAHDGITWQENHDEGLAQAQKARKPAVLILYADWCGFCKKLFAETIPDPRIRALHNRFAWVRVNSDKLVELKQRYGQNGFPMIVLFRADGTIARKLDGFQEPAALQAALQEVL